MTGDGILYRLACVASDERVFTPAAESLRSVCRGDRQSCDRLSCGGRVGMFRARSRLGSPRDLIPVSRHGRNAPPDLPSSSRLPWRATWATRASLMTNLLSGLQGGYRHYAGSRMGDERRFPAGDKTSARRWSSTVRAGLAVPDPLAEGAQSDPASHRRFITTLPFMGFAYQGLRALPPYCEAR